MEIQKEKIGDLLIVQKNNTKTIFCNHIAIVKFKVDNLIERRIAAIELVEQGNCNLKTAAKICGFHRNTVAKHLYTKENMGIKAIIKDDRGLKQPYKYTDKIRSHIGSLLCKHPDWRDTHIARQSSNDLKMDISHKAVARIRSTIKDDIKRVNIFSNLAGKWKKPQLRKTSRYNIIGRAYSTRKKTKIYL